MIDRPILPVVRDVPNVGALVDTALRQAGMSHKQAALICEVDFAEWSRALHGKGRFDLDWLARLPWRFQAAFVPLYVIAVTERALREWEAGSALPEKAMRSAKAELRSDRKKATA